MNKQSLINRLGHYFQEKNKLIEGNNDCISNWRTIAPIDLYNKPTVNCNIKLPPIIAHAFWHGIIKRKQLFSLKSFLCTQDMNQFEIWLWLDKDSLQLNKDNKELESLITKSKNKVIIKEWDVIKEIRGTKLQSYKLYFLWERPLPAISDDFRIIALHKWGGLYFDLDVMFCRDFSDLLKRGEFTYAWEKQPFANTAILYLNKQSYLSEMIINIVRKKLSSQPWVVFRYEIKELSKMIIYPCAMFDPLWNGYCEGMPIKRFDEFFREFDCEFKRMESIKSHKDFFPGIYAYHWHNCWDYPEKNNSYFGIFEEEFNSILQRH